MLCSRGLLRPLSAAWTGCPGVGAAAWAALPALRPLSSAPAGVGSGEDKIVEQHHQEEVAEEEAEEWALGQREHHEHEGFEALPWPPLTADQPYSGANCGGAQHNGVNGGAGAGPVRFYSGQAGGGGRGAAGGEAEGAASAVPAWERAEVLWEAEEPQPGSWKQGGEERDPFQGEEVNPHSEDAMSASAREKLLSEEASRIADETGP